MSIDIFPRNYHVSHIVLNVVAQYLDVCDYESGSCRGFFWRQLRFICVAILGLIHSLPRDLTRTNNQHLQNKHFCFLFLVHKQLSTVV